MIVPLLVMTTNIAAPDADAPDKDSTAAHDELLPLPQLFRGRDNRQHIEICR